MKKFIIIFIILIIGNCSKQIIEYNPGYSKIKWNKKRMGILPILTLKKNVKLKTKRKVEMLLVNILRKQQLCECIGSGEIINEIHKKGVYNDYKYLPDLYRTKMFFFDDEELSVVKELQIIGRALSLDYILIPQILNEKIKNYLKEEKKQ